jgi:hypothetical protein
MGIASCWNKLEISAATRWFQKTEYRAILKELFHAEQLRRMSSVPMSLYIALMLRRSKHPSQVIVSLPQIRTYPPSTIKSV